jgi:hypothetical protein
MLPKKTLPKKLALATAVAATIGVVGVAGMAQAAEVPTYNPTSGIKGNFTMLSPQGSGATAYNPNYNSTATPNDPNGDPFIRGGPGYVFGGANNVVFSWTGTLYNANSDYTGPGGNSNATISSGTTFFGSLWTAHTVQLFGPGTYTFDSTTGGGAAESGNIVMTVGTGQIGAHMLFDWPADDPNTNVVETNLNIDVANVYNLNAVFGSGTCLDINGNTGNNASATNPTASNCLWTGTGNPFPKNTATTVFSLSSIDDDGDGTIGIPMRPGGPFPGFNANFNLQHGTLTAIPIPAAVWLFGSGIMGLAAIARRKKAKS